MAYSNFFTQPQVPLDPRLNAAPMVAEQPTFTVGEYAKKRRIADALRAKASADVPGQLDPTGKSEGANGAPGEVYINWGNILSNAAQPWIKGRQEDKAAAAEEDLQTSQDAMLDSLDYSNLDPKMVMQLQRMGIDPTAVMKAAEVKEKKRPPLKNRQEVTYAWMTGDLTDDQRDQLIKEIEAGELAKQRAAAAGKTTVTVAGDQAAQADVWGDTFNEEDAKKSVAIVHDLETRAESLGEAQAANQFISNWAQNPDRFTVGQGALRLLNGAGLEIAGALIDPETKQAMSASTDKVRAVLKDLGGGDSNTDVKFAQAAQATGALTQKQAIAIAKFQEYMTNVARDAVIAKAAWHRNRANWGSSKPKPDFYGMARAKYADEMNAAMGDFKSEGVRAPTSKTHTGSNGVQVKITLPGQNKTP